MIKSKKKQQATPPINTEESILSLKEVDNLAKERWKRHAFLRSHYAKSACDFVNSIENYPKNLHYSGYGKIKFVNKNIDKRDENWRYGNMVEIVECCRVEYLFFMDEDIKSIKSYNHSGFTSVSPIISETEKGLYVQCKKSAFETVFADELKEENYNHKLNAYEVDDIEDVLSKGFRWHDSRIFVINSLADLFKKYPNTREALEAPVSNDPLIDSFSDFINDVENEELFYKFIPNLVEFYVTRNYAQREPYYNQERDIQIQKEFLEMFREAGYFDKPGGQKYFEFCYRKIETE